MDRLIGALGNALFVILASVACSGRYHANDELVAASNSRVGAQSACRRRGGYILQDTLTGEMTVVISQGYSDWCNVEIVYNGASAGKRLVGFFHAHPYFPNDFVTRCPDTEIGPNGELRAKSPPSYTSHRIVGAGPSALDKVSLFNMNQALQAAGLPPVDEYVIDRQNIYRINKSNPLGAFPVYNHQACVNWLN